jgi:hypothetical protein
MSIINNESFHCKLQYLYCLSFNKSISQSFMFHNTFSEEKNYDKISCFVRNLQSILDSYKSLNLSAESQYVCDGVL